MRRLIWGFVGRTYYIVGNLMLWLNYVSVLFLFSPKYDLCCSCPPLGVRPGSHWSRTTDWSPFSLFNVEIRLQESKELWRQCALLWWNSCKSLLLSTTCNTIHSISPSTLYTYHMHKLLVKTLVNGALVNCEDSDGKLQNVAFHESLHCCFGENTLYWQNYIVISDFKLWPLRCQYEPS